MANHVSLKEVQDKLKRLYSRTYDETPAPETPAPETPAPETPAPDRTREKRARAACWEIYCQLKPSQLLPSKFEINFKTGRENPETLKNLIEREVMGAFDSLSDDDETSERKAINAFVDNHVKGNEMKGPVSVSAKVGKTGLKKFVKGRKRRFPLYISCKVIELSLAGRVVWETDDGKAADGKGATDFWKFEYSERKLIEASLLHSSCKTRNVPRDVNLLLPVMYWKEGSDTDWVMYRKDSKTTVKSEPPSWATDYLDHIKGSRGKRVLNEKMQLFPKEEVEEPNNHHNAVYLLLCRFKKGVPEDVRVQAYAGRATNGVESRWLEHAAKSKKLIESYKYRSSEPFSAEPLTGSLLVDVLVARLYAQGGSTYLIDNDNEDHDNIALFVYHAYGEKKTKKTTGAEDKRMVRKENKFIEKLKLTDMKYGMNLKGPPKK